MESEKNSCNTPHARSLQTAGSECLRWCVRALQVGLRLTLFLLTCRHITRFERRFPTLNRSTMGIGAGIEGGEVVPVSVLAPGVRVLNRKDGPLSGER